MNQIRILHISLKIFHYFYQLALIYLRNFKTDKKNNLLIKTKKKQKFKTKSKI
jgi:hypothetical protein